MKTCTTYGDMIADKASENYPVDIYCDECAKSLDEEGVLVSVENNIAGWSDSCSICGKTQAQEQTEAQENQTDDAADAADDADIAPTSNAPQDVYPTTVNVSADDSSVYELRRQYEKGRINLAPKFQRHNVWNTKQKSELIESILMGIPLPIMYFFQNKEGINQVIDGKQRLTTLFDFLDNKFSLSELSVLSNLKSKKFSDLSGIQQGKIEDYKLSINVIKPPTPDRIKFDIFDRVNRGGTRLNNQEMRNAIYQGKATDLLEVLKNSNNFKNATDNSIRQRVMKDSYMISRFLAFYLWRKKLLIDAENNLIEYRSDIDNFLGKTMEFLNNCTDSQLSELATTFEKAMENSFSVLGDNGFRVSTYLEKERRTSVSMALFECLAYLFTFEQSILNPEQTKAKIKQLFSDQEFLSAVTTPVDSSTKVNLRFQKIEELIEGL